MIEKRSRGVALFASCLMLSLAASAGAEVKVVGNVTSRRDLVSGVATSDSVWGFGGTDPHRRYDEVFQVSNSAGAASVTVNQNLPEPLFGITSAWDFRPRHGGPCESGCLYLFGGVKDDTLRGTTPDPYWLKSLVDTILRFDPTTGEFKKMSARLPHPMAVSAAVFDGHFFYLFGGFVCKKTNDDNTQEHCGQVDTILKYDPQGDEIQELSVSLPYPVDRATAVWTVHELGCESGCAYIIGGRWGRDDLSPVSRFKPTTSLTPEGAFLTTHEVTEVLRDLNDTVRSKLDRWDATAVFDGRRIFVFGGISDGYYGGRGYDEVVLLEPVSGLVIGGCGVPLVEPCTEDMPVPRWAAGGGCVNGSAYLLGGATAAPNAQEVDGAYFPRPDGDTDWYLRDDVLEYPLLPTLDSTPLGANLAIVGGASHNLLKLIFRAPCILPPNLEFYAYEIVDGVARELGGPRPIPSFEVLATACQPSNYYVVGKDSLGEDVVVTSVSTGLPLEAPREVRALLTASTWATISWQTPDLCGTPDGYRIYRSVDGAPRQLIAEVGSSVQAWTDPSTVIAKTVTYTITAFHGVVESGPSNEVVVRSAG